MPTNPTPTDPSQRALEEARAALQQTDPRPCDCAQQVDGIWRHDCHCGNSGDLESVSLWCVDENRVPRLAHRMDRLIAQVRASTIEECARVAETPGCFKTDTSPLAEWCRACATAIRSLLSPPPAEEIPKS